MVQQGLIQLGVDNGNKLSMLNIVGCSFHRTSRRRSAVLNILWGSVRKERREDSWQCQQCEKRVHLNTKARDWASKGMDGQRMLWPEGIIGQKNERPKFNKTEERIAHLIYIYLIHSMPLDESIGSMRSVPRGSMGEKRPNP